MSDIADTSSKPSAKRDARTDEQAFAQVEKWMAMIREIDREPQTDHKRADLAPLQHDPEKWNPVFRKDHAQTKS